MSKHEPESLEHLKQLIETKRRQMVELVSRKGFLDPEVLRISEQLDEMILRFLRMLAKNCLPESTEKDAGDDHG